MLQSNIEIIKKQILKACGDAMDEIGITGTAELQSNAPVKKGTLRRSITFKKADSESKYKITVVLWIMLITQSLEINLKDG